jgi:hypothetical protein
VATYAVDVPAVDALSAGVSAVAVDVRAQVADVNSGACVDAGQADLDAAVTRFMEAWGGFTLASADTVTASAGSISTTARAYEHVDAAIVADLGVTSAFVQEVAAGGDGTAALAAAKQRSGGRRP